jgi:hypothetical protein
MRCLSRSSEIETRKQGGDILRKVACRMVHWDERAESKTSDIRILEILVKKVISLEKQEAKQMTQDLKILGKLAGKMINDSGKNGIKPDLTIMEQVAT